jgi:quinol-cytochrome oxidoreductase complex cytochrome b subunit
MLWRKLLLLAFCLILGNFIYELLPWRHHWGAAVEHSYFQAWALLVAWIVLKPRRSAV